MNASKKIRILAALGTVSGAVWAGTFATFTDSGTAESTFSTGTVDLELSNELDDAYDFATLTTSNMKPGDVKYAPLTMENAGTLGFSYSMSTSATNADTKGLAGQLVAGVKIAASCDATGYDALTATTVAAEGALSNLAISSRTLASAASEVLCFKVSLPSSTGDTFQNASTNATFTFSATQ